MQVLHELPGQSQPPWPQLNPTVLPSGFSLHLHTPVPSQSLVLSHRPAVPLPQRNHALSPASRAAEKRKEKPNLPKQHPPHPNIHVPLPSSLLPYSPYCLLEEATHFGDGGSHAPETAPDLFCRSV